MKYKIVLIKNKLNKLNEKFEGILKRKEYGVVVYSKNCNGLYTFWRYKFFKLIKIEDNLSSDKAQFKISILMKED